MDDYYSEAEMKEMCRRMADNGYSCIYVEELSCQRCWLNDHNNCCRFVYSYDRRRIVDLILRDLVVLRNGELHIVEED